MIQTNKVCHFQLARLAEELEDLFDTSETQLYERISASIDSIKDLDYIEDHEPYSNSRPFQTTKKGLDLLNETNAFEYLEAALAQP